MLPWHRPHRFRDPAWAREWVRQYDEGAEHLIALDTSRIDLAPGAMVPA
jgi:hypothetical protein